MRTLKLRKIWSAWKCVDRPRSALEVHTFMHSYALLYNQGRHQSSLDQPCQLKIAKQCSDAWVSSWIVFPMSEYGRYGGPMRYYSGRCVALILKQSATGSVLAENTAIYLKNHFSDSTLQICSSGIHSSQSRMVSDWCSCVLLRAGCNWAWQTDPSK